MWKLLKLRSPRPDPGLNSEPLPERELNPIRFEQIIYHTKKGFDPSDEYLEEKMIKFDKTGDTQLNFEEFKNLCQAVRLDHDVIDAETTMKNQICPRKTYK